MAIEETFKQYVGEWKAYCSELRIKNVHHHPESVLKCEAYKRIVELGTEVFGEMRKLYDIPCKQDHELAMIRFMGLPGAIEEITKHAFKVPSEFSDNLGNIARYTQNWLDSEMKKN